ncbi:MAG: tRNA adenosine(34) deaminase TadA [Acidobacteriaceae bacterium]
MATAKATLDNSAPRDACSPPRVSDEHWMRLALEQARLAQDAGEVPVGALLLDSSGKLLAEGQNRVIRDNDPTAHAEIVAIRAAGQALGNYRLEHCSLFVTLEPCAMCSGAMVHARIQSLVFGTFDPKAGAAGSVLSVLNHPQLNHRMELNGGVLQAECGDLLRAFFQSRR